MAPLIVLVVVTGLARIIGWLSGLDWLNSWPHATQIGLALMFLLTASAHFQQPKRGYLIAMVPPRLPNAAAMVTLTGILELAGATGLLVPLTTKLAAGCLAALMLALFPANVRAAKAPGGIKTMPLPLRALVQLAFIGACALVIAG